MESIQEQGEASEITNPILEIPDTTPRPTQEINAAALKLQKVYRSFRTRRNIADAAVITEELWHKAFDFASLERSNVPSFEGQNFETASSRWARVRTKAATIEKGLFKYERELALRHWLEAIDPRHRSGHNLKLYYDAWINSKSNEPFFYWLDIGEGKELHLKNCPRIRLQRQCIKYLGSKEREIYEVIVEDGKLVYRKTGMLINTTDHCKWIFVLSTSKALYVGKKQKGVFEHSSFLSGGAVTAAGRLVAKDGILQEIWPYSGQYRPTEENFKEFISFLEEHNVDLANVEVVNSSNEYIVPEEVESAGFNICADELASIVEGHDVKKLKIHDGVEGIAGKLSTSIVGGISTSEDLLNKRRKTYGVNKFIESPAWGFWMFVWEALQDRTLRILVVCAFVSLIVGIATEGRSKHAHYGLGILASILLVILVIATNDYMKYMHFKNLEKEKKKISVHATRNGLRQKVSIYDLVPGDIVHLSIGDQVRADGLFVSGFSLVLNKSSLAVESNPVQVNATNPFLLSGNKVQDGSCKMLVTAVGMRTRWGKLMSLSEGEDDETPLQVKLNGVATVFGKIGLFFAVITFGVLVEGLFRHKLQEGTHWIWSGDDAMAILEFFAVTVSVVAVAVPEGLPLAVTLSHAFAFEKMNKKALVRHLAACETMGSATAICSGKTGTLTTNHMNVIKTCVCGEIKEVGSLKTALNFRSTIPNVVLQLLLESIFNNTGGEIVSNRDNKFEILGSPIEAAILEFGLLLGGNFQEEREKAKIVRVEPFSFTKKRMGVVIELPVGGFRAHFKGASDIVLAACNKYINTDGEVVPLDEASLNHLKNAVDKFASEALQTLCFAYLEIGSKFSDERSIPFKGYTFIGIVGIKNPVRPGVKESVAICRSAGLVVRMVTGDNITTAKAIARECGILTDKGVAIEGPKLLEKSEKELLELIPKIQVIAQCSPLDKYVLLKHLQTSFGDVVAMTGDDTNDAPVLREADIGLTLGITGTEVAKESADVIILDDFSTIVTLVKWGRSIYSNIQKLVQFQLTIIVAVLIVNFSAAVWIGNAPLTTVQLLWVNLITDPLGAVALVSEPPNDDLMNISPVGRKGSFITNVMWRNILGQSTYQFAMFWYLQSRGKAIFHLVGTDSDFILNTLIFNSFVFCQVFNEINSREMGKINVFRGIKKNYVFMAIFTCTVLFQIIIVQFMGTYTNTSPLSWKQWFLTVFLGFLSIPIGAAIKMIPVGPN